MLKVLLASLILLIPACAISPVEWNPQTPYEYVCEQVENLYPNSTCEGLEEPQVIMTRFPELIGAYGVYFPGEKYLFVTPTGARIETTIIHEIAHYVLWELDIARERCKSEELARFIAGQEPDIWRVRYGCTKK